MTLDFPDADRELAAMAAVTRALEHLDPEVRERVLGWAIKRFSALGASTAPSLSAGTALTPNQQFEDFATLYDAAGPKTDPDRALVASYWLQDVQGEKNFKGQQANDLLKDLGHRVSNITDALSAGVRRKPNEIMQTGKSGSAKQARKTYRLTQAGIRRVNSMISSRADGGDNDEF